MIQIKGKAIIIADTHFGIKKFSIKVLREQLSFFTRQVFPYMEENNIKTIIQLGDLMDQRTTADINFIDVLKQEFFEVLKEKGIKLYAIVGNHDIYHRESRKVTLVKFFKELYPDNFTLFENREEIMFNDYKTLMVPWIVKGEELTYNEIKDVHTVIGHFEIRHFQLVKGHMDENAKLTSDFFTKNTQVRNVFSGHYHIKDTNGMVKYLGTPWQINWSDYDAENGFYVWDEFDGLEFFHNTSTKKHVKVKYNDEMSDGRHIEISGLYNSSRRFNDEEFDKVKHLLENHEVKVFINKAKDRAYDDVLYSLKESGIKTTIIDNQEISEIIGLDYISEEDINEQDTTGMVINTVRDNRPDLVPLIQDILSEINSNKK